jgi:XRE family transcriptional regulator, regulator of sulfur utilization
METPSAPQIGPVLQRQRKSRGLTLEQLASISGVSKSMLSQIERGQANPTFAVLWSLTRALKIEFADLLEGGSVPADAPQIDVVSSSHTPEIKSADGLCRLRILGPPQLAGQTEWYEIEIAPDGHLDSAPHAPGAFEHLTAFTTGFEITSGDATRALKAGETARYPADVPHRIVNRSSKPARGLMVLLYR